jgi:thiol-disulfide isomerase/thioredoxin
MIKTTTAIFLALLLGACSPSETEKSSNSTQKKEQLEENASTSSTKQPNNLKKEVKEPILTIHTLDEKEIHIAETTGGLIFQEYKNKALFVILFGYRCPPCLQEMPNLIAIMEKKYPDLEIIAIEVQGLGNEELEAFKKKKGINYTLAIGRENNQFINYIASRAQWQGSIPFFLGFNKQGEVKNVHVGALSSKQLESAYRDLRQ